MGLALIFGIFLIYAIISAYLRRGDFEPKLLDGEKTLLTFEKVKYSEVGGLYHFPHHDKKIVVTDKRIIISLNLFGVETFFRSASFYYKKQRGINYNILPPFRQNHVIEEYWLKEHHFCFKTHGSHAAHELFVPHPMHLYHIVKEKMLEAHPHKKKTISRL